MTPSQRGVASTPVLGTVAGDVVKRAACDVLVIRPADGATELEVPESAPLA